jgi:hypothetical protein
MSFARQITTDEERVYAWDAETATGTLAMMVVAGAIQIVEGIVRH